MRSENYIDFAETFRLFENCENARLRPHTDFNPMAEGEFRTVEFDNLEKESVGGIPLVAYKDDNGKMQVSMTNDTHALVIGATRSGKSTGYIMPMLHIKAHQKRKDNMFITDPKGELYARHAEMLRAKGYKVILLNFRDCRNSEYWNPLTPIFKNYRKAQTVEDKVKAIKRGKQHYCFEYEGNIYENKASLDKVIRQEKFQLNLAVDKEIQAVTQYFVPVSPNAKDPCWDEGAQNCFRAFLYAMLEDSNLPEDDPHRITEEKFSLKTLIELFNHFNAPSASEIRKVDGGYFSSRDENCRSLRWISQVFFISAKQTASSYFSSFASHLWKYQEINTMHLTAANTFDIDELAGVDQPVAIFVAFRDEVSESYILIQNFISTVYKRLIELADGMGGALIRPFYFLCDEFGNLPRIKDFEHVISACGGRNIWFVLVIQSYTQLKAIYGDIGEIIKDNLGMHVFFGTNNYETKVDFSRECGQKTIISPESALSGSGTRLDRFQFSTLPLIPVSDLVCTENMCIITRMMADAVVKSRIERSYTSPDIYERYPATSLNQYKPNKIVDFSDPIYAYNYDFDFDGRRLQRSKSRWDDMF